jgi:hypothetical protein
LVSKTRTGLDDQHAIAFFGQTQSGNLASESGAHNHHIGVEIIHELLLPRVSQRCCRHAFLGHPLLLVAS